MTVAKTKDTIPTFQVIDRDALQALAEKGKADPSVVRTVRCRTVAEGRKFRHLNYIRSVPAHIVDVSPSLLGDDISSNSTESPLGVLATCVSIGSYLIKITC